MIYYLNRMGFCIESVTLCKALAAFWLTPDACALTLGCLELLSCCGDDCMSFLFLPSITTKGPNSLLLSTTTTSYHHCFPFITYFINIHLLLRSGYPDNIMKFIASTVLLGAANAAVHPGQQVLKNPFTEQIPLADAVKPVKEAWSNSMQSLADSMSSMTSEVKAVWDEVSMLFPDAMSKATYFSPPKPHTRKPDSTWDYVVKGADVQNVWVENSAGQKERMVDGKLDNYNLRAKKVDPKKLGVDTVKQYSGYLDDEEEDKVSFRTSYRLYKLY